MLRELNLVEEDVRLCHVDVVEDLIEVENATADLYRVLIKITFINIKQSLQLTNRFAKLQPPNPCIVEDFLNR